MEHHFDWIKGFVFPYLNFFIFVGVLYFFARPKINEMLAAKRKDFAELMKSSQMARDEALAQAKQLNERLVGLDEEIARILDQARKTAQAEADAILENAQQLAKHIRDEAQRISMSELENARLGLRTEIVSEVSLQVEKKLSTDLSEADHNSLLNKDIGQLKNFSFGRLN